MYRRRPRFGLPELVSSPRPPRLVPSMAAGVVGGVVALALTLSACSSAVDQSATDSPVDNTGDDAGGEGNGTDSDSDVSDGDDSSGNGASGDGASDSTDTLSFGDPADAGFEEVEEPEPEPVPVDDDDREVLSAPAEVIPEIEEQLDAAPAAEEILDTVAIIDTAPVDDGGDDKGRSGVGGVALLDEPASLACAHIEISLTLIDEGNSSGAVERVRSAGEQADGSELSTVRSWSAPITEAIVNGEVADFAPLIGFLSVCAEGGYEL